MSRNEPSPSNDHETVARPIQRVQRTNEHMLDRDVLVARAFSPYRTSPRPFLRWAGSKRSLVKEIVPFLPRQFRAYHEPFLGSGALFFLVRPERAWLSDKCGELIDVFTVIRDGVSAVIRYLKPLKPDRELFYAIRNRPSQGRLKRAAEFLYLNKTCWNGLYRVNSEGQFNVPYGRPKTDFIADFENLRACSETLQKPGVRLRSCDFEEALANVEAGDLVYLDPPYVTRHNNNGFIDYNKTLFAWEDQKRLARRARQLAEAGAYVIVTNASHRDVMNLYRGFTSRAISRSSTLASDPKCRARVNEVILCSSNCGRGI